MSLLQQLFGKAAPTSACISVEIEKASTDLAAARSKIAAALSGLETMTDAEHIVAEALRTELKRAEARLVARIEILTSDRERVLAAEADAARIAADAQHTAHIEAARNSVANEVPKLLVEYDVLAEKIAAVIGKLIQIDAEGAAVNVPGIARAHRKHEVKYQKELPREEVRAASFDDRGGGPNRVSVGCTAIPAALPIRVNDRRRCCNAMFAR